MTSTAERSTHSARNAPPDSDWLACQGCQTLLYRKRFERSLHVCPECGWHGRLTAAQRLTQLLDPGVAEPVVPAATAHDPLGFVDLIPYAERLATARSSTGLEDAVVVLRGQLADGPVVAAVMDFRFLGGSLGVAAGEAITTAAEAALADRVPLLLVTASGGARMHEGVLSLMQMAKTASAMAALDEAGLLTITLVTDPTYGGVAASFATLSDVIIAEPKARMGFAGPRVIEQTIRQRLPEGFQSAEFLLEHGVVDDVRPRPELPHTLGVLLAANRPIPPNWGQTDGDPVLRTVDELVERPITETMKLARHPARPTTLDHLAHWMDGFIELHGDRAGADCAAVVGGLGVLDGLPVMVIGHQKGHSTAELVRRNFGMPSPAGYRKAARLMRMAAKLRVPVVTLIDTPGADPGLGAEENGQMVAIAECLRVMSSLPVPIVSVVTGEGGSGGALAFGVADQVLMSANAIYSVISPEGCAAILWKTADATARAAAELRIDARNLLRAGIVDGVVPEPDGGAHENPTEAVGLVRDAVINALKVLRRRSGPQLVRTRRQRFRRFGLVEGQLATAGEDQS
ncbi:MAG TPA: acetyl-CoA carboxylase, carboxyltransferase subunit beta [Pseudonocardiaceae bacterium]